MADGLADPRDIALPAGAPVPHGVWRLAEGGVEVFVRLERRRRFLWAGGAGATLFVAAEGPVLMLATQASRLERLDPAALVTDPLRVGQAAAWLDGWLLALAAGAAAWAPVRPATAVAARAAGVAWSPGGAVALCGIAAAGPAPLTPALWLAAPVPAHTSTADVLRTGWAPALGRFNAWLFDALTAWDGAAEAAEAARAAERTLMLNAVLRRASASLSEVLTARRQPVAVPPTDAEYALRQVAAPPVQPPAQPATGAMLGGFVTGSGLRWRPVTLAGSWWRQDRGDLLTTRLADGAPVAIKPDWLGRPRLHAAGAPPRRVDAGLAAGLDPAAMAIIPPLPDRAMSVAALVLRGVALSRGELAGIAAASLAAALLGLLLPAATGLVVDRLLPGGRPGPIVMVGVGLGLLTACNALLTLGMELSRLRMDGRLEGSLQAAVLDRVLRLPLPALRAMPSADLSLRVMSVEQIRRMVTHTALDMMVSAAFGLASLGLLFFYDTLGGWLALAALAALLAAAVLSALAQTAALKRGGASSANLAALTLQIVQNVPTLRAFGAESRAWSRWAAAAATARSRGLWTRMAALRFEAFVAGFDGIATMLMFGVLARAALGAHLPVGGYLAFMAAFAGFQQSAEQVSRFVLQLLSARPMLARAQTVLASVPETAPGAADPGALSGALAFSEVAFAYGDGGRVLDGVSFTVAPGELVALTGSSGSGKSTLMSLALGFMRPQAGAVIYDGRDLANLDLAAVRRQIGVVRQGGRLLGGSLLEAIRGMHDCSLEAAWEAAALAGIADDIRRLPMGMHTMLMDGSPSFSGGQIQRLLLARALAGRPRLLMLDEATSALDNITQADVTRNIAALGISRLVIAHRLSTVQQADRIHFLADGRIAESGSYAALIRGGGRFARFAARQML